MADGRGWLLGLLVVPLLGSLSPADTRQPVLPPMFTVLPLATATRTPTPINIGNFVWDDLDSDGVQDAGEPGMSGITVQLWNGPRTDLIDTTQTNANGNYTLVAPTPGDYRIRVVLPSAVDSFSPKDAIADDTDDSDINPGGLTAGFTDVITLASNVISITSIDAGIVRFRTPTPTRTPTPINIGNFVWDDLDSDGVQDAGEPGVANVTVQLWNGSRTQLLATAVTNANGNYTLVAPTPGDYRIRVVLPNGASFAPKSQGGSTTQDSDINPTGPVAGFTDIITLASNVISITSIDAGLLNVPAVIASPTPSATPTRTPTVSPVPTTTLGPATTRVLLPIVIR